VQPLADRGIFILAVHEYSPIVRQQSSWIVQMYSSMYGRVRGRVFSEFRRYGIPYIFCNSVYSVYYMELLQIPRNYAEFRIAEFRDFWCNEIPHNFNFTTAGFYNRIGEGWDGPV
jgi:hypothetical protein